VALEFISSEDKLTEIKSLLFDHHHGHQEDHHERTPSQAMSCHGYFQGGVDTDVSFGAIAAAGPCADVKRRIDKVEMVEETDYDDVVRCDSYDKRCHTTYVTMYKSQQEEECVNLLNSSCQGLWWLEEK